MIFGKKERELVRDLARTEAELEAVKVENTRLKAENQLLKAEIKINRQWNNLMTYDGTPQKIEEDENEG